MSIAIASRTYLSVTHLSAAALFAKQSRDIESSGTLMSLDATGLRQHHACVVSAVIMSAAFLEANINELFSDCADEQFARNLSTLRAKDLMGRLWEKGIPRTASYSILEKYEIALELNDKAGFNTGATPYQDVKLLVELRNALIHFEPETIQSHSVNEAQKVHKFEKRFAGKFSPNALTGAKNPFYPDKLLGAGCANWAIMSAVAFTDEFYERLGTEPIYEYVRGHFF